MIPLLNKNEQTATILAIDAIIEDKVECIPAKYQIPLVQKTMDKLRSMSVLTHFTDQELYLMLFAINYLIEKTDAYEEKLGDEFYQIFDEELKPIFNMEYEDFYDEVLIPVYNRLLDLSPDSIDFSSLA